jgi:stearoyl-CoA desaturase (Delta-9 desaturase)
MSHTAVTPTATADDSRWCGSSADPATAPSRIISKFCWGNFIFFATISLITVTAVPWYIITQGVPRVEWMLLLIFSALTGMSITVGYHRFFAHRAFQANNIVKAVVLFFGAGAFEQSAIQWASQHRDHHRYVDTDLDPYGIHRGFWFAHILWFILYEYQTDYTNVKDLQNDPLVMHQHTYYIYWASVAGIIFPTLVGALLGHALGAFLLAVALRLTLVHHSTFSINSVCHVFGKATYDIDASARDHWIVALLTNGEGYHNFHHRFASDYRNGYRWYHWDPTKWMIKTLSFIGFTWDLHRMPNFSIEAARAAGEHARVKQDVHTQRLIDSAAIMEVAHQRYALLKDSLFAWEHAVKEYRRQCSEKSREMLTSFSRSMKEKQAAFTAARRQWVRFVNTHPSLTRAARI